MKHSDVSLGYVRLGHIRSYWSKLCCRGKNRKVPDKDWNPVQKMSNNCIQSSGYNSSQQTHITVHGADSKRQISILLCLARRASSRRTLKVDTSIFEAVTHIYSNAPPIREPRVARALKGVGCCITFDQVLPWWSTWITPGGA
jgi:hypothetical protein